MYAPEPEWYKDAIVYEVHVRAFSDSDEDGEGDFAGLTKNMSAPDMSWSSGPAPISPRNRCLSGPNRL